MTRRTYTDTAPGNPVGIDVTADDSRSHRLPASTGQPGNVGGGRHTQR